jgi:uncharacterized protein YgbK (DUF1537 family)
VTGTQIERARDAGFAQLPIQPRLVLDPDTAAQHCSDVVSGALAKLSDGTPVVAHTAVGPHDPRREQMESAAEEYGLSMPEANARLGDALGQIALDVTRSSSLRRLVVAGGDTAGRVQDMLGIRALQVAAPVGLAAPLCYVYSAIPEVNGIEVAMKGGQIGSEDYFVRALNTETAAFGEAALGSLEP